MHCCESDPQNNAGCARFHPPETEDQGRSGTQPACWPHHPGTLLTQQMEQQLRPCLQMHQSSELRRQEAGRPAGSFSQPGNVTAFSSAAEGYLLLRSSGLTGSALIGATLEMLAMNLIGSKGYLSQKRWPKGPVVTACKLSPNLESAYQAYSTIPFPKDCINLFLKSSLNQLGRLAVSLFAELNESQ